LPTSTSLLLGLIIFILVTCVVVIAARYTCENEQSCEQNNAAQKMTQQP
jgi:hypothetical protein